MECAQEIVQGEIVAVRVGRYTERKEIKMPQQNVEVKSDVKSEFLTIIDRLAEITRTRHALYQQQQPLREHMQVISARHALRIAMTRDTNGKALYLNEGMRRAEITIRLSEDMEFQDLMGKLRELSHLAACRRESLADSLQRW